MRDDWTVHEAAAVLEIDYRSVTRKIDRAADVVGRLFQADALATVVELLVAMGRLDAIAAQVIGWRSPPALHRAGAVLAGLSSPDRVERCLVPAFSKIARLMAADPNKTLTSLFIQMHGVDTKIDELTARMLEEANEGRLNRSALHPVRR